jgi:ABC-2 type transport system permease protein
MLKILHIVRKEFLQLRRDPRMVFIVIMAPLIQLLVLGYAANLDVRDIPIVFCDLDSSRASREFISQFPHSGYFTPAAVIDRLDDVDAWIDRGKASLAVVIPKGMGKMLARREPVPIQVIVDGAESQSAVIALSYATMITARYSRQVLVERLEGSGLAVPMSRINPEVRVWYNPELKSRHFFIPGILGMLLMVVTIVLTALAIVKEKETGTLEQLIVTPVKSPQLILGKLLPFFAIGLVDIVLVVLVATLWFRVPIKGNLGLLLALSPVFLLTTLGLGLFISTISKNQQQAMLSTIFFAMPMIILSGFIFPIANMPRIIQYFTYIVPLRYFLVIIRGLFLKASTFAELWPSAAALVAFGLAILGISILRFRKKIG